MKTLPEKLLGVHWRTTVTGIGTAIMSTLAALAALPYTLGSDATLIPPEWKPVIFRWSLGAALTLKVLNSIFQKDKAVSGTPSEGYLVGAKPTEPPRLIPNEATENLQISPESAGSDNSKQA